MKLSMIGGYKNFHLIVVIRKQSKLAKVCLNREKVTTFWFRN